MITSVKDNDIKEKWRDYFNNLFDANQQVVAQLAKASAPWEIASGNREVLCSKPTFVGQLL